MLLLIFMQNIDKYSQTFILELILTLILISIYGGVIVEKN